MSNTSIKFELKKGEVFVSAHKISIAEGKSIEGYVTYKMLVMLDNKGLLPKGYLTRVKNGHISLKCAYAKAQEVHQANSFPYVIRVKQVGNIYIVALIKLTATEKVA